MRDYDIESDLKQEKFQHLKLVQGDRGNKIKINVYEDGQPVNLAGCSVTAKYKRADGKVVDGTVENKTDNYFYAVMDNNITKVAGTLKMLFNIENGDVKVSTFLLLADVREGIGENTGSSGGDTEVTVDLNDYQKKTDNGLETKNKYIVGAINEVNSQCKDIANEIDSLVISGGGISPTAKTLLISILQNAVYFTDQSANITSLISALNSSGGDAPSTTSYTIINNLSNCSNSNSLTNVEKNSSYTATIVASEGYTLSGATVTITMGGVDITSTAYANGNINIADVTGNIIILVSALENTQYINTNWTTGYGINGAGQFYENATAMHSDIIDVTDYNTLYVSATSGSGFSSISAYDYQDALHQTFVKTINAVPRYLSVALTGEAYGNPVSIDVSNCSYVMIASSTSAFKDSIKIRGEK